MSRWRKSSFSNGNGGNNCVETFTTALSGQVFVRNSKLPRVAVTFSSEEWRAFLAGVKAGEFDEGAPEGDPRGHHPTCIESTSMIEMANGMRTFVCGPECPPVA